MNMKRICIVLVIVLLLFCIGCEKVKDNVDEDVNDIDVDNEIEKYISFTLNVQEFLFIEEGIETVNKVIDLHEQHNVPIDIYLTNAIVQIYEENAPVLLERLKTSSVVAVSYHVRPPLPYYTNYDFLGLDEMSEEELYETIVNYEEHALDLNTGLALEEQGGYEYLKELIGYAPLCVGTQAGVGVVGETVSRVFQEKGAMFTVVHGNSLTPYESEECLFIRQDDFMKLGEKRYDVYIRPENVDLRLFQCVGKEAGDVIEDGFSYVDSDIVFLNVKMHDNDFYSEKSAWTTAYLSGGRKAFNAGDFNYLDYKDETLLLEEDAKQEMWNIYEQAVIYSSSNYEIVNLFDVEEMLN
jgi:hypothetical protein